ncbi:urease accessory protein UreD [Streptomyces nojiriensis]|uniref:Urease accessory protein UreD n=2 Tax=Streptomyces nojiriensis TaxID=66374 RepID=A0ABQ3SRA0_9ACTN|nr:Urease accessory protein UreD [Streptomyces nojiriensis]GGS28267.1 urease accessory protein UreD [Streptomyces nojiriensis]GHI70582.1 urease accessory protein UreD [Streptomyces nojiriensis]
MSGASATDTAPAPTPVPASSVPVTPAMPPAGLRATARIHAVADGRGGTALPLLAGEGPLALRRTRSASGADAGVMLVGAMSAPLGGDHLTVEATAGPGARLTLASAAATLALPGRTGEPARYDVHLVLEDGASVRWLPEPLVSVRGSDLRVRTRVRLAPTARLVLREEQVLGRTGEVPGLLRSRLTVDRGGRPLLDQELACGPGAPGGWDGPAGLAGHRALGQLLVVDPAFAEDPPAAAVLGEFAAVTPLAGPAVLVTVLAADALLVRELLDEACHSYGW